MNRLTLALIISASLVAGFLLRGMLPSDEGPAAAQRIYQAPRPQAPVDPGTAPAAPEVASAPSPAFSTLFDQPTIFDTLYQAYRLAAEADIATLERYAIQAIAIDDPLFRWNIADIFVERMNALDVNAALDFVEALPDPENRSRLLTSVLTTWVRKDPEAALAYLESITDERLRMFAASVIGRDNSLPESVVVQARALSDADSSRQDNPQMAWHREREKVMRGIEVAPEQTLDDLLSRPPIDEGDEILMLAVQTLANQDPELALEYMQRYPERLNPHAYLILPILADSRPELALPLVEEYTQRTGDGGPMGIILATWMRDDPARVEDYLQSLPQQARFTASSRLSSHLMQEDPAAGLAWIAEHDAPGNPMLDMALMQGGPDVAAAAESTLAELPPGAQRNRMLQALASAKSRSEPEQALAWLQAYQDEEGFDQAYTSILNAWSGRDPEAVAEQLLRQPVQQGRADIYWTVAYSLATSDLEAANDWAAGLDTEARQMATMGVVQVMAQQDPEAARALVLAMPSGPVRDQVGASLAGALAGAENQQEWPEMMRELGVSDEFIESYIMVIGR